MPVTIELAGPESWEILSSEVLALLRELGEEADDLGTLRGDEVLRAWRANPQLMRAAIAREGDALVGIATVTEAFALYANGPFGIISEMRVSESRRSQGIGKLLVDAVIAYGAQRGWSRIEVTAPESSRWERTMSFYRNNGFTYAGPKLKILLERR